MSSKRKQEEEYNSEEDEDFVPDANDDEEPQELYTDGGASKKSSKAADRAKKEKLKIAASFERLKRKGPFDSDDELSVEEQESMTEPEEASEPPVKKQKVAEIEEEKPVTVPVQSTPAADDLYAMLMRGKAPTPKAKASAASTPASAATSAPTSATNGSAPSSSTTSTETSTASQDALAFFGALKKKSTSASAAKKPVSASSTSKFAMPTSWLAAPAATEKAAVEEALPASMLAGPETVTIKETYEFAGQQVEVERKVGMQEAAALREKKAASGLGDILDQLKGKNKITTLQKSKLDWNQFTEEANLEDEFSQNRKDGYLAKQEFLKTVDAAEQDAAREVRIKASKAAAAVYKR